MIFKFPKSLPESSIGMETHTPIEHKYQPSLKVYQEMLEIFRERINDESTGEKSFIDDLLPLYPLKNYGITDELKKIIETMPLFEARYFTLINVHFYSEPIHCFISSLIKHDGTISKDFLDDVFKICLSYSIRLDRLHEICYFLQKVKKQIGNVTYYRNFFQKLMIESGYEQETNNQRNVKSYKKIVSNKILMNTDFIFDPDFDFKNVYPVLETNEEIERILRSDLFNKRFGKKIQKYDPVFMSIVIMFIYGFCRSDCIGKSDKQLILNKLIRPIHMKHKIDFRDVEEVVESLDAEISFYWRFAFLNSPIRNREKIKSLYINPLLKVSNKMKILSDFIEKYKEEHYDEIKNHLYTVEKINLAILLQKQEKQIPIKTDLPDRTIIYYIIYVNKMKQVEKRIKSVNNIIYWWRYKKYNPLNGKYMLISRDHFNKTKLLD